jgi:hypothetical protein
LCSTARIVLLIPNQFIQHASKKSLACSNAALENFSLNDFSFKNNNNTDSIDQKKALYTMIILLLLSQLLHAQTLKLELGSAHVSKNEFRIPANSGTDVAIPNSDQIYYRIEGFWDLNEKNAVRFVYAPFSYDKGITPNTPLLFDTQTFLANTPTSLTFQFNSYRIGYVRHLIRETHYAFDLGFTLKMRDALISVSQNGLEEKFTDFGFVPLLYFSFLYKWNADWSLFLNADGAGASQGYAIDALLENRYQWSDALTLAIGYRYLDGGADNDTVKTFATIHYLNTSLYWTF